ncbi:hypothetical protein [Stenotrophomonas sp. Iso1]|uniref:hypothetical protein n=1 Tax=Stenotrophomonas sp. Iso1 TaxID=2977283 RepID=UPI0022B7B091|nr:hypothetical protein [Stenotrophomonas sp. Iso1]
MLYFRYVVEVAPVSRQRPDAALILIKQAFALSGQSAVLAFGKDGGSGLCC